MQTMAKLPGWDWALTCEERTKKDGKCVLQLPIAPQGAPIAELTVLPKNKSDVMEIIVPLGLMIPPGVRVAIGSGQPIPIAFETCNQVGCVAELPIDAATGDALAHNSGGRLIVVNGAGNEVPIAFSLRGFGAAMALRADDMRARDH
jgi:invasion protein IalB